MPEFSQVAVVGVGLIGGSIGLALRERRLAKEVIGIGRRAESLAKAQSAGAIDRSTTNLAEGVAKADLVILTTPVQKIIDLAVEVARSCPSNAVITDAGSTKEAIVAALDAALQAGGPKFVGSHPLAGDHRTGPENARADLLDGRTVIVTPTSQSDPDAVQRVTRFWQSLGAQVLNMTPAEHDAALAVTSHLPHVAAAALASTMTEELIPLAATGWRDTTRIAAGDPQLWRDIFATNRQNVLKALEQFETKLAELKAALGDADDQRLQTALEQAQRIRDAVGS